MSRKRGLTIGFLLLLALVPGCTKSCEKAPGGEKVGVFFIEPKDNAHVVSPVLVKFGVIGMTVRPAMEDVNDKTSGHHHLLIDDPKGYVEKGQVVPTDATHIHYGKGEESAEVALSPGVHTLTLQFADGAHISYGKDMAATITITVDKKPEAE